MAAGNAAACPPCLILCRLQNTAPARMKRVRHVASCCVRLQAGASEVPPFPAWQDAALRKTLCGPYDVATSAPRIVENFLDMAHFGFVHEGWLGAREHPAIPDYRVEEHEHGFSAPRLSRHPAAKQRTCYRKR